MSNPSGASRHAPNYFSLPSLEELEQAREAEEAEEPTRFFEAKRPKLAETSIEDLEVAEFESAAPPPPVASLLNTVPISAPGHGFQSPFLLPPPPPTRNIQATIKPTYRPGQTATGSSVDTNLLLIHERQRENPVTKYIRYVKWQHTPDIVPDFQFSANQCGLFLSMKYHQSNNNYILGRIVALPATYVVRILLVLVDIEDEEAMLLQLNGLAIARDMTLILAFSNEEVARYLETYKSLEHTNADTLKESAAKGSYVEQVRHALSPVKSLNSSDVLKLLATFGSLANIFTASLEQLATVPGLGEKKVAALFNAFHQPFITSAALLPTPATPSSMSSTKSTPISAFFKQRDGSGPSQAPSSI